MRKYAFFWGVKAVFQVKNGISGAEVLNQLKGGVSGLKAHVFFLNVTRQNLGKPRD